MAVTLGILAAVGKVLLVILCVILLLLALVLLVPIRYEGRVRGDGAEKEIHVNGGAFWLFRFLSAEISFSKTKEGTKRSTAFRICGISPAEVKARARAREKARRQERKRKAAEELRQTDPARYEAMKEDARRRRAEKEEENARRRTEKEEENARRAAEAERAQAEKNEEQLKRRKRPPLGVRISAAMIRGLKKLARHALELAARGAAALWSLPGRLLERLGKSLSRLASICGTMAKWTEFLGDERTKRAAARLWRTLRCLLKHVRPRELLGEAEFGLGDPALTGEVFGAVAAFYPLYDGRLTLTPDFADKRIDGDLAVRGRLVAGVVIWRLLLVLLDKNVRYVVRCLRNPKKEEV